MTSYWSQAPPTFQGKQSPRECRQQGLMLRATVEFCLPHPTRAWGQVPLIHKSVSVSSSVVSDSTTPLTVACQPPLSMGFPRQEYWSGLPFPSLGDLPEPGIEPRSPALQADSLPSEPPGKTSDMKGQVQMTPHGSCEVGWPEVSSRVAQFPYLKSEADNSVRVLPRGDGMRRWSRGAWQGVWPRVSAR